MVDFNLANSRDAQIDTSTTRQIGIIICGMKNHVALIDDETDKLTAKAKIWKRMKRYK